MGKFLLSVLALVVVLMSAPLMGYARESNQTFETRSLAGSFLAGRIARSKNDTRQAAKFYRLALAHDPDNKVLLEQSFLMEASEGNWKRANRLARRLVLKQPSHQMAHILLGLTAFKQKKYMSATRHFKAADSGPVGEITSTIARAWIALAKGDTPAALDQGHERAQAEWARFYIRYHRALIADLAGRRDLARREYKAVFERDSRTLRTALAYARFEAHRGDFKTARDILKKHIDDLQGDVHPLVAQLLKKLEKHKRTSRLIETTDEGMAEVFYGLGEALTNEGGVNIGIIYLQMALYLEPDYPFALAALANAYEASKRYQQAINAYNRIPKDTPLRSAIDIRNAFNLNSLGRVEDAKKLLDNLADRYPNDIRPLDALGNIMRVHKRYEDAISYYTRAIALIKKPQKKHWSFFYARGTCYERVKQWPKAEADLQKALELYPNQPMTLNYLGYSWIDQNRHLHEGMSLIERAVKLKPDDGYIVDSLGWAHYKLGNFEEAAIHLERAVELRPQDPVLNDHLGDAYWRVGREREARFQWGQSLTLSPEPENEKIIKQKLEKGLPPIREAKANPEPVSSTAVPAANIKRSAGTVDIPQPHQPN